MKIYPLIANVHPMDDTLNLAFSGAGRKRPAGQLLFFRRQKIIKGTYSKRQLANIHYRAGRQFKRTWQALPHHPDKVSIAARYAARWAQKGFIRLDVDKAAALAERALSPSQAVQIERLFNSLNSIRNPDGTPELGNDGGGAITLSPENMKASEKTHSV